MGAAKRDAGEPLAGGGSTQSAYGATQAGNTAKKRAVVATTRKLAVLLFVLCKAGVPLTRSNSRADSAKAPWGPKGIAVSKLRTRFSGGTG